MKLDTQLYESLLAEARENPRLRLAKDLRTTPADGSQRMLNALIPGTCVPIHRHTTSAETVVVLYGSVDEVYYDAQGNELERVTLQVAEGIQIPLGQFHTIVAHVPSVIIEMKDGEYEPPKPEDVIETH